MPRFPPTKLSGFLQGEKEVCIYIEWHMKYNLEKNIFHVLC